MSIIFNMTTGSNSEALLKDLREKLAALGNAEGKGSSSRPIAALRLVTAAHDGLIDEDDAADMFGSYVRVTRAGNERVLVGRGSDTLDSFKAQVSKFRAFIKVGMLPTIDAPSVMERAAALIGDLSKAGVKTHSPFDSLLNVAREQVKNPTDELTDEQINGLVCKAEPRDKDEVEKLVDAYKRACTLAEKIPMPATEAAVQAYGDAIIEMGGELPPRTKAEKELAAFKTKAAKMGLSIQ